MSEPISPPALLRLHIGCADIKLRDYVNIDVRSTPATDVVTEAWNLSMFKDATVAEVYTRHMIEHLEPDDAMKALREWVRVLVHGGVAHIICPDIVFHAKQLLGSVKCPLFGDQMQHAMSGFYGWKVVSRGGSQYDAHKWGYTIESLTKACHEAGFSKLDRVLDGKDSEPWHLNIKAFIH